MSASLPSLIVKSGMYNVNYSFFCVSRKQQKAEFKLLVTKLVSMCKIKLTIKTVRYKSSE